MRKKILFRVGLTAMVMIFFACNLGGNSHPIGPGDVDTSFLATGTGADINVVQSIALQSDGRILIGGNFTAYNGIARGSLARLNSDGSLDTSDNLNASVLSPNGILLPQVYAITVQTDGKILVGGYFASYNGTPTGSMARLNYDGSLDTSFLVAGALASSFVSSIALQPDGKILIGGSSGVARLNTDGSLDTSFHSTGTGADGEVCCLALQAGGKILIGGYFANYDGTPRGHIARLNTDGSLDSSFLATGAGVNNVVYSIAVQSDGRIVVGGNFAVYNGTASGYVARLNTDGSLDTSFLATGGGANSAVESVALQADGKVLIGGGFNSYNGATRWCMARLNTDGSIDRSFLDWAEYDDVHNGANVNVDSIVVQADGKILVGGGFTKFNEYPRGKIARLLN